MKQRPYLLFICSFFLCVVSPLSADKFQFHGEGKLSDALASWSGAATAKKAWLYPKALEDYMLKTIKSEREKQNVFELIRQLIVETEFHTDPCLTGCTSWCPSRIWSRAKCLDFLAMTYEQLGNKYLDEGKKNDAHILFFLALTCHLRKPDITSDFLFSHLDRMTERDTQTIFPWCMLRHYSQCVRLLKSLQKTCGSEGARIALRKLEEKEEQKALLDSLTGRSLKDYQLKQQTWNETVFMNMLSILPDSGNVASLTERMPEIFELINHPRWHETWEDDVCSGPPAKYSYGSGAAFHDAEAILAQYRNPLSFLKEPLHEEGAEGTPAAPGEILVLHAKRDAFEAPVVTLPERIARIEARIDQKQLALARAHNKQTSLEAEMASWVKPQKKRKTRQSGKKYRKLQRQIKTTRANINKLERQIDEFTQARAELTKDSPLPTARAL
jgi:hypothetical protein